MKKMLFPLLSVVLLTGPSAVADDKNVASADDVFSSAPATEKATDNDKSTAKADKENTSKSPDKKSAKKSTSSKAAPKVRHAVPTLDEITGQWHDPAFDQFVSIPLLGQAIDTNDVEGLTNSALQFVHAERVLFRSHKAITAEDVFSKALKAAHQANEKTCIERLSKAAKASGNNKLTGIVDSVGRLMAGSRSTGGQLTVNINEIDAGQYAQVCALRDSARRAQLIGHPAEYDAVRCQIEDSDCPQPCREQLLQTLGHPPEDDDETCHAVRMLADYTRSCNGGGGGFSGGGFGGGGFSGGGFGGLAHGGGMNYGGMTQGGGFQQGGHRIQQMQPMQRQAMPMTAQPAARPRVQQPTYPQPVRPTTPTTPTTARTAQPRPMMATAPQKPSLAQQLAKLSPQQRATLVQQLSGSTQPPTAAAARPQAIVPTAATRPAPTRPTASRPTGLPTALPGRPGALPSRPAGNAAAAKLLGAGSRSLSDGDGDGESSWAPWFEVNADGTETQGWTEYKPDGSWVKYDSEGNALEAGYDAETYTGNTGGEQPTNTGNDAGGMTTDYTRNADGSTSWTQYDANGNVVDRGIDIDANALNGSSQYQQPQQQAFGGQTQPGQDTPVQRQPAPISGNAAIQQASGGTGLQGGTGSQVTPADAQAALNLHNQARQEVGNRPMRWSSTLAQDAQRIADSLAARGVFDHEGRNAENLSAGTPSAESATKNFLEEKRLYQQGERAGMKVGHYTQMVWHNTTELGVGIAVYQSGPYRGRHVVVARYNPAGNMMGEEAYRGAGVIHW